MISLTLSLPCPANRIHTPLPMRIKGRTIAKKVLSREARTKRQRAISEIRKQLGGTGPKFGNCHMSVAWHPLSLKRCCDHDAYTKELCDIMQMAGVVNNDATICASTVERMPSRHPDHPKGVVFVSLWPV
jgi:Holliday junction resolvase RusA-like endonuclease